MLQTIRRITDRSDSLSVNNPIMTLIFSTYFNAYSYQLPFHFNVNLYNYKETEMMIRSTYYLLLKLLIQLSEKLSKKIKCAVWAYNVSIPFVQLVVNIYNEK